MVCAICRDESHVNTKVPCKNVRRPDAALPMAGMCPSTRLLLPLGAWAASSAREPALSTQTKGRPARLPPAVEHACRACGMCVGHARRRRIRVLSAEARGARWCVQRTFQLESHGIEMLPCVCWSAGKLGRASGEQTSWQHERHALERRPGLCITLPSPNPFLG